MKYWIGAAAICINESNQLLMVKQGTPEEEKLWSVPSGQKELAETNEQCCLRELKEETGYEGEIVRPLFVKKNTVDDFHIDVHYYEINIIGGEAKIQDPDELIHEIAWKPIQELMNLKLTYPGDRKLLLNLLEGKKEKQDQVLVTERCWLAKLQEADFEQVLNLYSNELVRKYLGGTVSEEQVAKSFQKTLHSNITQWSWTVTDQKTNQFVGMVSIDQHYNGIDYEISYQILPRWWGMGYGIEIVREILMYSFVNLNLPRVVAETQVANIKSRKLLEKLGFQREEIIERFGAEQMLYKLEKPLLERAIF